MVPLTGRWRIVEMDLWDRDAIDLVEPGFVEFVDDGTGQFGFVVVRGWMDWRSTERDGRTAVEFSWDGDDEGDAVSGRGWATLVDDANLEGHVFFHMGDDSGFRAEPVPRDERRDGR
ncbi:hypothetical protein [Frankia sp. Cr1]|uniref:hypothetical protein n=1 Tax=Frankia sp. Cr1 TaxID=3073931 RepID=UPI002AD553DB|nr:hypothetical protein [Frankia sp. Cr1]